jgi:hypothetical protein
MKINSNIIKLEKKAYEKLEEILKKIASENKIENVIGVNIKLSKIDGIVKFAIEDADDFFALFRPKQEGSGFGNNLENIIGVNPERNINGNFDPVYMGTVYGKTLTFSVQGGNRHYSIPEQAVPLSEYDAMETAVVFDRKPLRKDELLELGIPEEFIESVPFDRSVFPYLPIEKIEELFNIVKQAVNIKQQELH